jgi:uncharacterized membrane protein
VNDNPYSSAPNSVRQAQTRVSDRILGLSDGVFAIAITLLVLTIEVPSDLTSSEEVGRYLLEAFPEVVAYAAAFMVIGTFWLRHHHMFHMCRAVDGRMLVLNLVFLAFVSLLPFPSDLLGEVPSTSTVIVFCAVAGAATLCEFGLWRHLDRHRELLLLPDIPGEQVAALKTWRFWSLGVFVVCILVSLFSPKVAVLMVLALPLYELVYHRRYHRYGGTLYLLRDQ